MKSGWMSYLTTEWGGWQIIKDIIEVNWGIVLHLLDVDFPNECNIVVMQRNVLVLRKYMLKGLDMRNEVNFLSSKIKQI